MKPEFWKLFYRNWKQGNGPKTPGYTILMMVPGDLPVFLKIALEVCAAQNPEHLVEVLVIPDKSSKDFLQYFENLKGTWKHSPIRLALLNPAENAIVHCLNNPNSNNWLQFVSGCNAAASTHVLWHDADLFLRDKNFLKTHYEECVRDDYSCYGVSEVWDTWFKHNGYRHIAATWEIMLELDWVKKFQPWQHRGHDGYIDNQEKMFDSTLLPQCLTPAHKIGKRKESDAQEFIHFNYVISSCRHFQNAKGKYEDFKLKLLITRTFIDLFDDSGWVYEIPSFDSLYSGIINGDGRVTYNVEARRREYPEFREKMLRLGQSDYLSFHKKQLLAERIAVLDECFRFDDTPKLNELVHGGR